jgi:hypothetical protein
MAALGGFGFLGQDADLTPAAAGGFECYNPVDGGEERIVLSLGDIPPGVDVGAALADDDRSGVDKLAAVAFYTQTLGLAVTVVPAGAGAFFMSHG